MLLGRIFRASGGGSSPRKAYPYQPDVEHRLPNGRITTQGYAARRPTKFHHWETGPGNVLVESIDPTDWENWRMNYFGT